MSDSTLLAADLSWICSKILPSTAIAKLDFRLVPDMMPRKQLERLNNHLKEYRFSDNNIEIKFLDGVPPFRTPIDHPFVKLVEEAAIEVFTTAIISVSSAGTGPMYYFDKPPNEFTRIDLLNKTTKCIGSILEKIGKR